jgi:hypothetical protein
VFPPRFAGGLPSEDGTPNDWRIRDYFTPPFQISARIIGGVSEFMLLSSFAFLAFLTLRSLRLKNRLTAKNAKFFAKCAKN